MSPAVTSSQKNIFTVAFLWCVCTVRDVFPSVRVAMLYLLKVRTAPLSRNRAEQSLPPVDTDICRADGLEDALRDHTESVTWVTRQRAFSMFRSHPRSPH